MKLYLALLGAFLFVRGSVADAPDAQDIFKDGKEKFDKILDDVKAKLGVKDDMKGEDVVRIFNENSQKLATDIKEFGAKIEQQIKANPDATNFVNSVKAKVKEAQDNLKKEHPDVAQNLDKLSDSLKNTWVSFTQELENNYKEFAKKGGKKEEIENNIKSLIDKGSKAAKDLQTEIDKALDDKTKKN